jgi:hypothetical protein
MLKSAIAALTVSAAALLSAVTASPSFASTTTEPLVIGPQVTITVSCPRYHHAVDHEGQLSCVDDQRHHKAVVKKTTKATPQHTAVARWHHCWHWNNWAHNNWSNNNLADNNLADNNWTENDNNWSIAS